MFGKAVITVALFTPLLATDAVPPTTGLTVHEWGTFTSIATDDGGSEPWVSLAPPADLPCFVYHLNAQCIKCGYNRVRMETPVLYFYSAQPTVASVHVDLPSGLITEWYPQATHVENIQPGMTYGNRGNVEWPAVQVNPGANAEYPYAGDSSHYYAARETDAAPLRVGDQPEKLLFYRGIADFNIALQPVFLSDGKLEIRNTGPDSIGFAILFESRAGKTGYRLIRDIRGKALLDPPDLTEPAGSIPQELEGALTAAGLYPKEAAAMIETWRDSWFEEGMRLFYLVPRKTVDAVLPIKIAPAPTAMERVFVGRIELFSPSVQRTIEAAVESGDTKTMARYGRFLRPFCDRLNRRTPVKISQAASIFLARAAQTAAEPSTAPCRIETPTLPTEQR